MKYVADDGRVFESARACKAYEEREERAIAAREQFKPLLGLTQADLDAIIDRSDEPAKHLGLLIEKLSRHLYQARMDAGEFQRKGRSKYKANGVDDEDEDNEAMPDPRQVHTDTMARENAAFHQRPHGAAE